MTISGVFMAAIAARLKTFLSYKKTRTVRSKDLVKFLSVEEIEKVARLIQCRPRRLAHVGKIYYLLSNLFESGTLNMDTIMLLYIDHYVRTGKPMDYTTDFSRTELEEKLRFLSVLGVNEQFDLLDEIKEEISGQSAMSKFTGDYRTLFAVNGEQKNELYELVKKAKISNLLFAFFWKNSKFNIDEKKIEELEYLKFIYLMKYVIDKNITIENIKYEV